jgi:hypothetical protein
MSFGADALNRHSREAGVRKLLDRLDRRRASFEASLREAPQDEEFSQCRQRTTSC